MLKSPFIILQSCVRRWRNPWSTLPISMRNPWPKVSILGHPLLVLAISLHALCRKCLNPGRNPLNPTRSKKIAAADLGPLPCLPGLLGPATGLSYGPSVPRYLIIAGTSFLATIWSSEPAQSAMPFSIEEFMSISALKIISEFNKVGWFGFLLLNLNLLTPKEF